ncbi:hypothetical protein CRG98_007795 [Punica granatum]|uniref:Uncharacterized protein n=1 Tax=Punica granatum TaxID=22663 RepID=A0A2I0KTJ6_PUNGR|nr:hypothetical protein CRG98_007795 [Punica granatum]
MRVIRSRDPYTFPSSLGNLSGEVHIPCSYKRIIIPNCKCVEPNFVSSELACLRTIARLRSIHLIDGCVMEARKKESPLPVYDPEVESRLRGRKRSGSMRQGIGPRISTNRTMMVSSPRGPGL